MKTISKVEDIKGLKLTATRISDTDIQFDLNDSVIHYWYDAGLKTDADIWYSFAINGALFDVNYVTGEFSKDEKERITFYGLFQNDEGDMITNNDEWHQIDVLNPMTKAPMNEPKLYTFDVQLQETCVRTTTISVKAPNKDEALKIAETSPYGENDFSVVSCDVKALQAHIKLDIPDTIDVFMHDLIHDLNKIESNHGLLESKCYGIDFDGGFPLWTFGCVRVYFNDDWTRIEWIELNGTKIMEDLKVSPTNAKGLATYLAIL